MPETLTEDAALTWLAEAAADVEPHHAIVELGVYRGGSLRYLAEGAACGKRAPVYGVDSWGSVDGIYPGRPHMLQRYVPADKAIAEQATGGRAILVHDTTTSAAADYDGPLVGLLYIDAEHTRDAVIGDFRAWAPHLAGGATVAFDDYEPSRIGRGVMRAVGELVACDALSGLQVVGTRLAVATFTGISYGDDD